ncbi:Hypothetical predicted protein, partial [Mytilus galloprovincialis]
MSYILGNKSPAQESSTIAQTNPKVVSQTFGMASKGVASAYVFTLSVGYYGSQYCYQGCCSSFSSDPCCYYYIYSDFTLSVGAIVGIVIGVIVAIATIVTIAVCLCCACARSRPSTQGQVITAAQPNISYVATSNQS